MQKESGANSKAEKTILILSDSKLLFNIIAANLQQPNLNLFQCNITDDGSSPLQKNETPQDVNFDLIIVANSSSTSEPVVALAEAALEDQIGRIPLLIISDRNFAACRKKQIFHLEFPFNSEALRRSVLSLLESSYA